MRKRYSRWLSMILAGLMLMSVLPAVFAAEPEKAAEEFPEEETYSYDDILNDIRTLDGYAVEFSAANAAAYPDPAALTFNYLRTGIPVYTEGLWKELAGAPIQAFIDYVAQKDSENGTTASRVRTLNKGDKITAPNGDKMEFPHLFAMADMAYHNEANADLGGWAGDLVDLMQYTDCEGNLPEFTDIETWAEYIRLNCLGQQAADPEIGSFSFGDMYGDLDGFHFYTEMKNAEERRLAPLMENYYTASAPTEAIRSIYFLNQRFPGNITKEDVRSAMLTAYKGNFSIGLLEASRGLDGEKYENLRTACCYAFADWLFERAEGNLIPVEPEPEPTAEPSAPPMSNPYFEVFNTAHSNLAPGITQNIHKAMTADNKQIVYYVATVDANRPDIVVQANYGTDGSYWKLESVMNQVGRRVALHTNPADTEHYIENYTPIVSTNADGYNMSTGEPPMLILDGVLIKDFAPGHEGNFFGVTKNGSLIIGTKEQWSAYKDQLQHAFGVWTIVVKDGELVEGLSSEPRSRASRTAVGLTKDGKLIMMVLDGRQEPFSAGGSLAEVGQIMEDAGCWIAANVDGGGSTTYVARPEGEAEYRIVNRPSDGNPRLVGSSLLVASTAPASDVFDHAVFTASYDYMTPGASQTIAVSPVSQSGSIAQLPEGVKLISSDPAIALFDSETNTVTAVSAGDVEIQLVSADGSEVLGSKIFHIVAAPDALKFTKDFIPVVYSTTITMPLEATFNGNLVKLSGNEITCETEYTGTEVDCGTFDGLEFTAADESCGIRTTRVAAYLSDDVDIIALAVINFFTQDEAIFDFDHPTSGDRALAWNREVSNSTTDDAYVYTIDEPGTEMVTSYLFALDMNNLEIPDSLQDAIPLLGQFLGIDASTASAWDLMQKLAERISPSTTVTITVDVPSYMEVDLTGIAMNCECFTYSGYEQTEGPEGKDRYVLTCNWIKRYGPIEPNTVSPVCTISGIKLHVKENAPYDENNQLPVSLSGVIKYDARIRSSQAWNIAGSELGQSFGLYQYDNTPETVGPGGLVNDKGAGFKSTHRSFNDPFILDITVLNGWVQVGTAGEYAYYVNNDRLTGLQYLPAPDGSGEFWYDIDDLGISHGKYTGFMEDETGLRYVRNGSMMTGWVIITDETDGKDYDYYFDKQTGYAVNGEQTIDDFNYVFEDYKLVKGDLRLNIYYDHEDDPRYGKPVYQYRWAGWWRAYSWETIDGNTYYFGVAGWAMTNVFHVNYDNHYYVADEQGRFLDDFTGLYDYTLSSGEENTYYCVNGVLQEYPGVVWLDGYYYYFASNSVAIKNRGYWTTKTNGIIPEGYYHFDEQGRMIDPPTAEPDPTDTPAPTEIPEPTETPEPTITPEPTPLKNGIVAENGSLYYYENGQLTPAGLIFLDGYYYYVRTSNCEVVHGRSYWVSKTNGLLPEGRYTFDDDGKMLQPPVYTITWQNYDGTVLETDTNVVVGTMPVYDGDEPVRPEDVQNTYAFEGWTPEIVPAEADAVYTAVFTPTPKMYTITWLNDDGTLIDTTEVAYGEIPVHEVPSKASEDPFFAWEFKNWDPEPVPVVNDASYTAVFELTGLNGWVTTENGTTYLENGVQIYKDIQVTITDETDTGLYYFDAEGYLDGLIQLNDKDVENGHIYYYFENGQLIKSDNADEPLNYFVASNNDLPLPAGIKYRFDQNGVIVHDADTSKTGIQPGDDGLTYLFVDGVKIPWGLFEYPEASGTYYYARTSTGEIIMGRGYWVTQTNGLPVEPGYYEFDAEGRMIIPVVPKNGIVEENGSLYYYVDGEISPAGLIQLDGYYYYVRTSNGEVIHDRSYWVTKTNGLLPAGMYTFGSDGRMIVE